MKKKATVILLLSAMTFCSLAGCSGDEGENMTSSATTPDTASTSYNASTANTSASSPADYDADSPYMEGMDPLDYVTLKSYKGFSVSVVPPDAVTDEDVNNEIDNMIGSKDLEIVTGRDEVQDGDWVNIDYTGYIDGEESAAYSQNDKDIDTRSENFFAKGFEKSFVGHKVGDELTLNLKFPDNFEEDPENSGKDITFQVKINFIEKKLDLTNDIVEKADYTDEDGNKIITVSGLKEYTRRKLDDEAYSSYDSRFESAAIDYLLENNEINPPQVLVDRLLNLYINKTEEAGSIYDMDHNEMINILGYADDDEFMAGQKEKAEESAKIIVLFNAIAEKENISVSDYEYENIMANEASSYGYTSSAEFSSAVKDDPSFQELVLERSVMDWIKRTVKVVPAKSEGSE